MITFKGNDAAMRMIYEIVVSKSIAVCHPNCWSDAKPMKSKPRNNQMEVIVKGIQYNARQLYLSRAFTTAAAVTKRFPRTANKSEY